PFVAVCAAADPCMSVEAAKAGSEIGFVTLIRPTTAAGGDDSDGRDDSSSSDSSSGYSQRLQIPGVSYPHGVFVLTTSDGSGDGYSMEVCTRVPSSATCADFFGVMYILRPADALPSEADLDSDMYGAVHADMVWSSSLAQLAATASDSSAAVLTSGCYPPPGFDERQKAVVFSWSWDFSVLPPSLASTGFVAVYRRYPMKKMIPGSYVLKFGKPAKVDLAAIVRFVDGNPDVKGTTAAVREVVGTVENTTLVIPDGIVSDVTFMFWVPALEQMNNIPQLSAAITLLWRPSPPSPPPSPPP
ncbi:hypothetical protein Vretifemale_20286, partial [Volvox reticuliferus]